MSISKKSIKKIPLVPTRQVGTDQIGVDKSCQLFRKACLMTELRTTYPYGLNDRYGDKYKTENTQFFCRSMANKFPSLPRKYNKINWRNLYKGFCRLSS